MTETAEAAAAAPAAVAPAAAAGKGATSPLEWSTIYVGDLHPEVNEAILLEKFSSIGPVAAVHVCRDSITQRSMGYAYVNYYSQLDATQAIEKLNYTSIRGRCCRIMWNNKERPFRKNPDANIFVGNLDLELDSRSLYETFSIFGHIISCKVATSQDGNSKGYGFVQYESEDAAKQAIERLNGVVIGGKAVFVGPFKQRNVQKAEDGDERSLYVRNIPNQMDDVQVKELFSTYGVVESTLIMSQGKGSNRYGFINFADLQSAQKAVEELHGKDMRTAEERAAAEAEAAAAKTEADQEGDDSTKPAEPASGEEAKPDENEERENEDDKGAEKVAPYCLWVRPAKGRVEQEKRPKERKEIALETLEGVRLIVRSLPPDFDDDKLRRLFEPFGTVTDVKAVQDREAGECRGYGFVRLSTMDEASAAVKELHWKEIVAGRPPLNVGLASKGGGDRKGKGRDGKGFNPMGKHGKGFKGPAPFDMLRPHEMPNPYGHSMGMYGGMRPPMGGCWPPMVMPGWRPVPYAQPGLPGPRPGMGLAGMPMTGMMPGMQGPAARPPLTEQVLETLPANVRKQMLGEQLFPLVQKIEPEMASKITGMLLESLDSELLNLLQNAPALAKKVSEAKAVLVRP